MKKIYITGVSGTGKTTIGEELKKRGYYVLDIDLYELGLCLWKDINTGEKVRQKGQGEEWRNSHVWVCDKNKLQSFLNKRKESVVFAVGITSNQDEYLDLFDKVMLLKCSEEIFVNRIKYRTNNNYGKEKNELNFILNFYKSFEDNLIKKGAVLIDAEKSIEEVSNTILEKI